MTDALVVGAGIVGAACAYHLARAGARVTVLSAGPVAGGTSSAGEGNILVSDKEPGPELSLALWSRRLWTDIGEALDPATIELEPKTGLMVAATAGSYQRLTTLAARQRAAGVEAADVPGGALPDYEPHLAAGLAGGAYYPQDAQVQPMLATARLLAASGAEVRTGARVRAVTHRSGRATGVRVGGSQIRADAIVNAAGVAAGELARTAGTTLPVEPRRGFILVTEPLPVDPAPIRRKVYTAEYLGAVASDDAGLRTAAVIEGTRAGTVLIGSSRERSAAESYPLPVLRRIAAEAVALFPFLAAVRILRAYRGFRPYVPDHLPVIGPDPHLAGLWHACGHEGAGIGLAPATGALIAAQITGATPAVDPTPFAPSRFTRT